MKKTLAILAITPLVLSSCFFNRTETPDKIETPPTPNPTEVSSGVTSVTPSPVSPDVEKNIVSKGDTVGVDYVGTLEDGTIFDSSIEEFAKKTKNYTPGGREYKPLSFSVGAGQMIKGFDAGVVGMKLGEKKTITIAPADAYGEAFKEQEVPAKYFQNVFTETVPRENFKDTVVQTVPVSAL